MADQRVVNLARVLVQYSMKVQERELVAIFGQPVATPLITEVYREVLRAGAYPYLFVRSDIPTLPGLGDLDYIFLSEANEDQLKHVDPIGEKMINDFDVWIRILSRSNTRSLSSIEPSRIQLRTRAHAPLSRKWDERTATGALRWTLSLYPTQAYAQESEMSLGELEDYVYSCTFSDVDDPVGKWRGFHDSQQRLVEWLDGKKHIVVKGTDIDLSFSIEGRKFINCSGIVNMPDGEIFTGPVEDSANGWARFAFPVVHRGREIHGVEMHLENGKVVKASAESGEESLLSILDTDPGASLIGEFGIGTNKNVNRFIRNMLFDEKILGTIHLAIGSGYPESGSKNESLIHLDMLCDMREGGEITADGELFYRSGEFMI